jgi:hypothetical protein
MGGLLTLIGGYLVAMTLRRRGPLPRPEAGQDGRAAEPPDQEPQISYVRFEPEFVSQDPPFSLGRNLETGRPVFAIPVRNRMVEYEEWYSISEVEMEALLKDFDLAAGYAYLCGDRELDDRLILKPGTDRGVYPEARAKRGAVPGR